MSSVRRPKLGQHFLRDPRFSRRLEEAVQVEPGELILEIGPGRGGMTRRLASRAGRLVAVELDPALAASLEAEFQNEPRIEIVRGDILKTDLRALCERQGVKRCFVFGNLPYYITSPILLHLFAARASIRRMALLVQREVAERIAAAPGTREYGSLSVVAQCHAEPRIVLSIPPGAFSPPPNVYSALVDFRIVPRFPEWDEQTLEAFLAFVHRCFARKRKNLLNNLTAVYSRERATNALRAASVDQHARAEQLSPEQLARLFDLLR